MFGIVVLITATVWLTAWVTGFEVATCVTGGSTTVQPASVGLVVHWVTVGSTAEQPPNVGVDRHALSVGSTAVQPA